MAPVEVLCVGEALVDFLPLEPGRAVRAVETWKRCSGGAPANVAVGLARLGVRSSLVGVVGQDEFGHFLRDRLAAEGVDVRHLRQTEQGKTGLVFISLSATGERTFSFYRQRSAEYFLDARDVHPAHLREARAIHFGTNSLLFPAAREALQEMVSVAAAADRVVSCDPNLRLHLWPDPDELRALVRGMLPRCGLVKLSEEETEFVTGASDALGALRWLRAQGVALPVVTRGAQGAVFLAGDEVLAVEAPKVNVVDTTGAGDGFMAALLLGITRSGASASTLETLAPSRLREVMSLACHVGARVVQKFGAVDGLPRRDELGPAFLAGAVGGSQPT